MRREPPIEGTALLVRFQRDEDERKLLLVLHDTKPGQLRAVTDRMRELVRGNPDWIARTSSIGEAEKEPADQRLAMEHLVSRDASDGSSRVHEGVIERLLNRLFSDTPGTDFIQTSGVARGPRFFDRPEARNAVLKAASEHRWVLLEAVRRFGKTSLLVSIGDTQPDDAVSMYVSLEGSSSPEHLPRTLVAHAICHPELRGILPAELTGSVEPDATPYEAMDALARKGRSAGDDLSLCWHSLEKQHRKVLFLIDELAFHLSSLRTSASNGRRSDSEWKSLVIPILDVLTSAPENVGFVLAGSLHLPAFLDGHAVRHPLVDSLLPVSLEPISDHEAETMFRLAFLGQRVLATDDEVRWILDRFGGWAPYFSLRFIDLVGETCRHRGDLAEDEMRLRYKALFGARNRALFSDLDMQHNRHADYVDEPGFGSRLCSMLVQAAEAGDSGVERERLERSFHEAVRYESGTTENTRARCLAIAFTIIKHDYSVVERNGRYAVACRFLADWILSRRQEWKVG